MEERITFLRRPEVPGFWPSKGVVSTRETLKSTMAGYLIWETEIETVFVREKEEEEDARNVMCGIYL